MKITLRKANALQNTIQDHIKTIEVNTSISLNEFQTPQAELSIARNTVVTNDMRRANLTKALYRIRAAVGRANTESGVADLLADAAFVDKRLGQLKALTDSNVVEADAVIDGKLQKLRDNKSERHSFYGNDKVDTGVLTADQIEMYRVEVRGLKKEKQSINDKVLELNVRTEIELDADVVALLQAEQLV